LAQRAPKEYAQQGKDIILRQASRALFLGKEIYHFLRFAAFSTHYF